MALKKDESMPYGITINYWRVLEIKIDARINDIHVLVGGYVSRETRVSGAEPATYRNYELGMLQFDCEKMVDSIKSGGHVYQIVYSALKDIEDFRGAEDV